MKSLIFLLMLAAPALADTTSGGCFNNKDVEIDVSTDVTHIFNAADVTFTSGNSSVTVNGVPSGGGNRVSDSSTATLTGVGKFKISDGEVQFKKDGTTRWKTLGPCKTDEGIGTLPSTAGGLMHVPSTAGLDGPSPQKPPRIDDDPLPAI